MSETSLENSRGCRSKVRERTCLVALASFTLLAACSKTTIPPEPPPPAGVVGLDEAGLERVRSQNHGRVLLINFWATWCEPCREEFPAIVQLHKTYRARGLSVVEVSMDEPESVPAVEEFLKSQRAEFGSYRQRFGDFAALVDKINPQWGGGIPASFLFDREGKLVHSWEGATSFQEFDSAVRALLP